MNSRTCVHLPQQSYEVINEVGSLDHLGTLLAETRTRLPNLGRKVLLVSNPKIFQHYGSRAIATLTQAGFEVAHCLLPAGERYKTLNSVQKLYNAALANHLDRSSAIIALGGGVVGDMAGFAAATWLRGIHIVQVPTSLLAMVDSAIGGKTGVNHPFGKNLIGAFYQPRMVVIDPEILKTLPPREFRAGMSEVIKYGVIWDADLFHELENLSDLQQYRSLASERLQWILSRACQAKAEVVAQDEREAGVRALLNYGHTIGHAIESLTRYRLFNHGEAVALGMIAAGDIAVAKVWWSTQDNQRQLALIKKAGLPTQLPETLDLAAIVRALTFDKKVKDGKVRFVLPTRIGASKVTDQVPSDFVTHSLLKLQAQTSSFESICSTASALTFSG